MNTIIYLIRHGSVINPLNLTYGRIRDVSLSKEGKQQIEYTAKKINEKRDYPNIIVSSPQKRTKESSVIIQNLFPDVNIVYKQELLESDSKNFVGRPLSWARSIQNPQDPKVQELLGIYIEPEEEQRKRMLTCIREYGEQYQGKVILFVSHGHPLAFALDGLLRPDEKPKTIQELKAEIYLSHGEAWRLECDKDFLVVSKQRIRLDSNQL